jgi:hypothetical protein
MKKILNILFVTLLILFGFSPVISFAQDAPGKDNTAKTISRDGGHDAIAKNTNPGDDDIRKPENDANKKGKVKQVKSARPDMSKSRGARPPDIVRPSGSRIPKGVGRPAGSAMHGR